MPRLPFITFEGSEGCGKSTQVRRLAARLETANVPFLVTREPGGTSIGESIRELLQFTPHASGMKPETELLLFEASRSQLGDCIPDITFILDVDEATAHLRMQKPRRADRMEQESPEFYERVRQAYRELAVRESNRMVLLDGSQPADQIEKEIWEKITSRFAMDEGRAPEDASKASVRGVRRSRMDRD